MARRPYLIRLWLSTALACSVAPSSDAQTASRPFRGLFGAETASSNRRSTMKLDWSLFEDYRTDVLAGAGPTLDPGAAVKGHASGAEAQLTMKHDGRRVSFGAATSTTVRYYPALKDLATASGDASVDVSVRLGRRSYARIGQMASYSPFYQLEMPTVAPGVQLDGIVSDGAYAISRLDTYRVATAVGLTHPIGARTAVSADYSVQRVTSSQHGLIAQRVGGRLSRQIGRNLSAHAGYGYRVGRTRVMDLAPTSQTHDLDIGVDYARALSFSRRTTLSFSSGSSIVSLGDQRTFGVLGLASLTHQIGRTWTTSAQYRRGLDYIDGFSRPLFSDSISGYIDGMLGRRAEVAALMTSSAGALAGVADPSGLASWSAFARFRFAVSRRLAIYAQYGSHYYRLARPGNDALRLSEGFVRQGIRVGLTGRIPLLH